MGNPGPYKRDKRTGKFATQFETTSGYDPVNADGPDPESVLADGTGIVPVDHAYKVKEPIASPVTFADAFGRHTRPNPHRAAVLIDGRTGQRIADFSNDEVDRLLAKRQKHMEAAGTDPLLSNLFGDPAKNYNGGN